jgi:hypothetical protein
MTLKQEETPAENPSQILTRSDQPVIKDYSHRKPNARKLNATQQKLVCTWYGEMRM